MQQASDASTKSRSSITEGEDQLWRRLVRTELSALLGAGEERSRIEDELAQMLRDEAEAEGVDCRDKESAFAWLVGHRERLEALVKELQRSVPAARVVHDDAPLDGNTGTGFSGTFFSGLAADFRVAGRTLLKRPGLTGVILVTLVLGIGLNSAVFSVLNSVLFKPLAISEPDRLVRLYSSMPNGFLPEEPMAIPDLIDLRDSDAVEDVAGQALSFTALSVASQAEMVMIDMVTDNFFGLLGVSPLRGRLFAAEELFNTEGDVVVISAASWKRRFASSPGVIGQVVKLNGHPLEIVGVVPGNFRGLIRGIEPELWIPMSTGLRIGASPSTNSGRITEKSLIEDRGRRSTWGIARIKPGWSEAQVRADVENTAGVLASEFPESNEDRTFTVIPFSDVKVMPAWDANVDTVSFVLLGLVFLVLLIASANLANLLLARAMARRGEMATRLSLGASRGRIVRQLLVESLLLAGLGAAGGLGLAYFASRIVSQVRMDMVIPLQVSVSLDGRVVFFTVLIATLTSVLFGLMPAIEASRTDLASVMGESAGRGGKRLRFQSSLVALQVAFSVVLLIFAGLALRSVINASNIDIGIETEGVAAIMLSPDSQGYEETEVVAFYREFEKRLKGLPGVAGVSSTSHLPLTLFINTSEGVPSHRIGEDPDTWPTVDTGAADDAYFDVLGIPVLRGRTFLRSELEESARVVVVNQALAEEFWEGQDAVGQTIVFDPDPEIEPHRVVGVVGNGKYRTLGEQLRRHVYFPLKEEASMRTVAVRFARPGQASGEPLLRIAREIDPDLAVMSSGTAQEMMGTSVLIPKVAASVFGGLGLIGLLLSAIGLFGVLAYSVSQRTHEIGLRVAIGASTINILTLVARRGLLLVGVGITLGMVVAFAVTRFLSAMLYGISTTDAVTFVAVVAVLLLVTLVATLVPARIALNISPTEALRYE